VTESNIIAGLIALTDIIVKAYSNLLLFEAYGWNLQQMATWSANNLSKVTKSLVLFALGYLSLLVITLIFGQMQSTVIFGLCCFLNLMGYCFAKRLPQNV
jgi:hypothetical protein